MFKCSTGMLQRLPGKPEYSPWHLLKENKSHSSPVRACLDGLLIALLAVSDRRLGPQQ